MVIRGRTDVSWDVRGSLARVSFAARATMIYPVAFDIDNPPDLTAIG
jgi:hypothetical protein